MPNENQNLTSQIPKPGGQGSYFDFWNPSAKPNDVLLFGNNLTNQSPQIRNVVQQGMGSPYMDPSTREQVGVKLNQNFDTTFGGNRFNQQFYNSAFKGLGEMNQPIMNRGMGEMDRPNPYLNQSNPYLRKIT